MHQGELLPVDSSLGDIIIF